MSDPSRDPTVVDAYCHVGLPRFSSAEDGLAVLGLNQIHQAVIVLGPDVPDYPTLFSAIEQYGDRIRGVGIPFGRDAAQVRESVALQISAGVMGLRIQEEAHLTDPAVLDPLGRKGRWIYGINVLRSAEIVRTLLDWLEYHPQARLGAPHFLRPAPLFDGSPLDDLKRALLTHPRFYPIFSRHGGNGSRMPYPHPDYRPWVEQVVETAGWDRLLWGSEFPVLVWRNESVKSCRGWLSALLPEVEQEHLRAFLGGNAKRAIFAQPAPPVETAPIPEWVEAQFNRNRTVTLLAQQGLDVPMALYARLHHQYVAHLQQLPDLSFAGYLARLLDAGVPAEEA